jgi:hypothetical protein
MSVFLDDLVIQLAAEGCGSSGIDIFLSTMAHIPVFLSSGTLQLIETGGTAPENTQNTTITPAYLRPSAQITARANTYAVAKAKADAAFAALYKVRNQAIGSTFYRSIACLQSPFDGGPDSRGQAQVQFNVIAIKRP